MNPQEKQTLPCTEMPEVLGARHEVPLLDGSRIESAFFDNAASTKPFREVSEFIQQIEPFYSNIHRGTGFDSVYCTQLYEQARNRVLNFVGGEPGTHIVIPVRNTTEGLNLLAMTMNLDPKRDVVLSSILEHHSNDLPWRGKAKVEHIPANLEGDLDLDWLRARLEHHAGAVKLIAVTGASNVLGNVTPIHDIAKLAHEHGAKIAVDGAQLVPHRRVNLCESDDPCHIDYLVFSAHKMNSPYGEGAVVGDFQHFADATPYLQGGGTVYSVGLDHVIWADPPDKQEAGTPNILGLIALAKAIEVMERVGMDAIEKHEAALTKRLLEGMRKIPKVGIFGKNDPEDLEDRLGVVTFTVAGMHHAEVAAILSYEGGISVRNGCFCAHPLIKHMLNVTPEQEAAFEKAIHKGDRSDVPGAVRVSIGIHNTEEEVDRFLACLSRIAKGDILGKYKLDKSLGEYFPIDYFFDFKGLPQIDT